MERPTANVIMLLANGFHPDPRVHREAVTLVEHGFAVTILCLDRDENLEPEERLDGIRVRRLRVGRVREGKISSLAVALPRFYVRAVREARALHASQPLDLIHCHDLDTVLPGLLLRRRCGAPVVYDLHDLYSSYFGGGLLQRVFQKIDERIYRTVQGMILVNDRFLSLPHIGRCATAVVMNVPPRAGSRRTPTTDGRLFYAGNLNRSRDMRYALPVLRESGLRARFAGDGPLLEAHRAANGGECVDFLGRIPPAEVSDRTRDCLAVLALYDTSNPNNRLASPNKLFEAMKWGKPAIVSADTVMAAIVEHWRCGIAVGYGDPASLRAALTELRDLDRYRFMSRNAHRAFLEAFNWDVMAVRLLSLYEGLLRPRGR